MLIHPICTHAGRRSESQLGPGEIRTAIRPAPRHRVEICTAILSKFVPQYCVEIRTAIRAAASVRARVCVPVPDAGWNVSAASRDRSDNEEGACCYGQHDLSHQSVCDAAPVLAVSSLAPCNFFRLMEQGRFDAASIPRAVISKSVAGCLWACAHRLQ